MWHLSSFFWTQMNSIWKVCWDCTLLNMAIFLAVCFGKRFIFLCIVSFWCYSPAKMQLLTVAAVAKVTEIMLQQRVLCISMENKIKACPTKACPTEVKLLTLAKINELSWPPCLLRRKLFWAWVYKHIFISCSQFSACFHTLVHFCW